MLLSIDMIAFFDGATDMVDYLATITVLNIIINAFFIVGGALLAVGIYWMITSGEDD